jgi:hypothetical protein
MPNLLTLLSGQIPSLNLPSASPQSLSGGGCGPCSGVQNYNTQNQDPCNFTPASNPVNPSSTWQPSSRPNTSLTNPGPTNVSPIIGQTIPGYFNPPKTPQFQPKPQPNVTPYSKQPCTPTKVIPQVVPQVKPITLPGPQQNTNPTTAGHPDPCGKPGYYANNFSTNNFGSMVLPLNTLRGQNGNVLEIPNYPQPQLGLQPQKAPPILQSGKQRSAVTPNDFCVLQ